MKRKYGDWAARWRVPLSFAFAVAYVVLSQPGRPLLVAGAIIALAGLLLRGWAAGSVDKNESLATSGPFSYTRNPLYLGSFILGVGFMIAGGSWALGIAFVALFIFIYSPVMRREAEFLRQKFGFIYEDYARLVPAFFPVLRPKRYRPSDFRWARYQKNREYEAAGGYAAILIFLVIKLMLRCG
ncbi:MAG TPA: isoprenylcysteine carboxylmethyltransferase family protein [Terriglobia bacterium]|nr:isoprenylcysteine carboxylmethyltransferase family protein [Terriglobia bacterium]